MEIFFPDWQNRLSWIEITSFAAFKTNNLPLGTGRLPSRFASSQTQLKSRPEPRGRKSPRFRNLRVSSFLSSCCPLMTALSPYAQNTQAGCRSTLQPQAATDISLPPRLTTQISSINTIHSHPNNPSWWYPHPHIIKRHLTNKLYIDDQNVILTSINKGSSKTPGLIAISDIIPQV